MKQYLFFQLYAPLASWGDEAVGEIRPTSAIPTRSALLGMLAAALGIRRDEEQRLNEFNRSYHLAVRPMSERSAWLRDYHTVSAPRENKKRSYRTRRDELTQAPDEVGTIITRREYLADAYWHIALSACPQAEFSLEQLQTALCYPVFHLYLGRKSCPPALPLHPHLAEGTLQQIFRCAEQEFAGVLPLPFSAGLNQCYWDDPDEASIERQEIYQCYHQPVSRKRWQFERYPCFGGQLTEEA